MPSDKRRGPATTPGPHDPPPRSAQVVLIVTERQRARTRLAGQRRRRDVSTQLEELASLVEHYRTWTRVGAA